MTRPFLAERWWIRTAGTRTAGLGYPNVLTVGSALGSVCALDGPWHRRPVAVGTALMVGLKLLWLRAPVRRFDRRVASQSSE